MRASVLLPEIDARECARAENGCAQVSACGRRCARMFCRPKLMRAVAELPKMDARECVLAEEDARECSLIARLRNINERHFAPAKNRFF